MQRTDSSNLATGIMTTSIINKKNKQMKTTIFDCDYQSQGELDLNLFFSMCKDRNSPLYYEGNHHGECITNGLGQTARWFTPYGTFYKSPAAVSPMETNSLIVLTIETASKKESSEIIDKVKASEFVRACYRDQYQNKVFIYVATDCPGPGSYELTEDAIKFMQELSGKTVQLLPDGLASRCRIPNDRDFYLNVNSTLFVPKFAFQLAHIELLSKAIKDLQINIVCSDVTYERIGLAISKKYGAEGWNTFLNLTCFYESDLCNPLFDYELFCNSEKSESMHFLFDRIRQYRLNPVTLKTMNPYGK